jgi:hypothetical protein
MVKNRVQDMRRYFILILLVVFLLITGCISYISSLTATKPVLQLNQTATFEQDGYLFEVSIDHISTMSSSGGPATITIGVTATNTGEKGITLIAYPRIADTAGTYYPGTSIFFGTITPGGKASGRSSITITPDAAGRFRDNGLLSIRLQAVKPMPWEATWYVDFHKLP